MQVVDSSFHTLAQGNIIPLAWGNKISFYKNFDDSLDFGIYDVSTYDGGDLFAPTTDEPINFWDYYDYADYSNRVQSMEWHRELDFPYSVSSAMADFTMKNTDDFFTPDPSPPVPIATNHSKNPSFELGDGTVEVRRNLVPNPSFETGLGGWNISGSGAGILNRSAFWSKYGDYAAFVTPTNASDTNDIRLAGSGLNTFPAGMQPGKTYTISGTTRYNVNVLGTSDRRPRILYFYVVGGSYIPDFGPYAPTTAGEHFVSHTITVPANATGAVVALGCAMGSTNNCFWDGIKIEEISVDLPYFDGSTNDGFDTASLTHSWTGAANNSASVLIGQNPKGFDTSGDGAGMIAWLSSDSPNRGGRFARSLIRNNLVVAFNHRDTVGVANNEERTSTMMVRSTRAVAGALRYIGPTGFTSVAIGNENIPANTWHEIKITGSPNVNNGGLSLRFLTSTFQAGDIVDFDNHYVVKGNYTGSYFDGKSDNASWNGSTNDSTSTLYQARTIQSYILPKRPVRLFAGYGSFKLQQFVGITEHAPTLDEQNKLAIFHANDFLVEIFKQSLTEVIAMENARTDEVLSEIFEQFGISPSSYTLDKGVNVIPFVFFDKDKNAGNAIRELMQAEGGHLWIDENGIIRFQNRLPNDSDVSIVLDDSNVIELVESGDSKIINYIKIKSKIRRVADYQVIFSNARQGDEYLSASDSFVIPASSSLPYYINLEDPCLTITEPTIGEQIGDSWFTAVNSAGASVTSNVSVTGSTQNANQYVVFFNNTNTFPVEIDQLEVWGRPAKVVNTINYVAKDQDSIDKYEKQSLGGEEGIANDFFGSQYNCEAFSYIILDSYSEFNPTIEATIVGDFSLQLGDIVQLQARGKDAAYKITSITTEMYPHSFKIKARKSMARSWAKYDITVYDDPIDVIAP